jgi:hypothetical protein
VDNDGETQSYPTKANTAWLVNTQKTHWVVNHQPRHLFMLTFNRPFAEMLAWFRSKPAFHYGK